MRYLVDRGTGSIVPLNDDLVIVDTAILELYDNVAILELASKATPKDKPVILASDECPVRLSDDYIYNELYDYVYNWQDVLGNDDDYKYCLSNPDTWPLIRDAVIEDNALWNEYADTWSNAIHTVASDHRYRNGVAE